ncbi:MAG: HAD-IIIA family hydrolase [Eubacterium sp.]|nr:HAD-IIIA family hydrolase [Eubacterium sp.]
MKYDLVIFDMDGTVLDSLTDLAAAMNRALRESGLPERSREDLKNALGKGARWFADHAAPEDAAPQQKEEVYQRFIRFYDGNNAVHTAPYPGIPELLRELRAAGVKTAVVSNKMDPAARALSERHFGPLMDIAVGERKGVRRKPAPDAVLEVLKELDTAPERAVYVGDSEVDVETGRNAGMDVISVTWGYRDKAVLEAAGGTCFAADAAELKKQLGF